MEELLARLGRQYLPGWSDSLINCKAAAYTGMENEVGGGRAKVAGWGWRRRYKVHFLVELRQNPRSFHA